MAENRVLINLYPPFLGSGIRLLERNEEWSQLTVGLSLGFWNRNYVGVQYGGSLYSMTDPWYMLMLIKQLGSGYTVWDKSASIRFIRPGTSRVTARFELTKATVDEIRERVDTHGRDVAQFTIPIIDINHQVVAEVEKTISIRRQSSMTMTQK
jgi:hypothetical protein